MIFNAQPGELFVLRNVANLVPPYEPDAAFHATSAALEFAVRVLQVRTLIVLGHAMCGGIQVLLDETAAPAGDFLVPWMRIAEPARRRVLQRGAQDPQAECERESVKLSLENLHSFPWIAERAAAGNLELAGAMFDIRSGLLQTLQPDGSFEPV
jgi:carbonic anhydrase